MKFEVRRKKCSLRKTHGERKSSSGMTFGEFCGMRGKCSKENCIFIDAGGDENGNDPIADNEEIR